MSPRERIEEAMREVGVLLMAFAPLDGLLQPRELIPWPRLSFFLSLGIFLFALAIVFERRHSI